MVTRENRPDKHFGSDKRYGLNKSLAPLIDELVQRGIEVTYLSQTDAGVKGLTKLRKFHRIINKLFAGLFKETEFTAISWGILERLNMGRLAVKVMAQGQYTHVHCHDPFIAAGYRWFARLRWYACLRQCHTARWGVTEHGFGSFSQAFHDDGARLGTRVMKWLKAWECKILLKAHWVINPTQAGLKQLARDLSVYPIPSTWYAIPHPSPAINVYEKREARRRLKWDANILYIIAVGRFAKLKQFPELVKACSRLKHRRWKLFLIGEGDRNEIQQLAKKHNIEHNIGYAISDDIGLFYSAADIYVSTSLTESFGLANFEALHMGLPSICTAVGGVPEVLGSGARMIPANNEAALVNAIQDFLDNKLIREYWTNQARNWIDSWPDVEFIANDIQNCYNGQLLKSTPLLPNNKNDFFSNIGAQINSLQLCPMPEVLKLPPSGTKILLFAPHFDDETFACGGTLALLRQRGCSIAVVIVTDGSSNEKVIGKQEVDVPSLRLSETNKALDVLGIEDRIFLSEPDGEYIDNAKSRNSFSSIIEKFAPDWIFVPPLLDSHKDHIAVSYSILQIWNERNFKERLFLYETWVPIPTTTIVDISSVMDTKLKAMECYQFPHKYCDYMNAFKGLAAYRGLYLQKEGQYAEAFAEVKEDSWQSLMVSFFTIRRYQEQLLNFKQQILS